jgi:hypothetical protein
MTNEPFSSPSFRLSGTSNGTDSQNQLNPLNIPARDTTCDGVILVLSVVCGFDLSDCQQCGYVETDGFTSSLNSIII